MSKLHFFPNQNSPQHKHQVKSFVVEKSRNKCFPGNFALSSRRLESGALFPLTDGPFWLMPVSLLLLHKVWKIHWLRLAGRGKMHTTANFSRSVADCCRQRGISLSWGGRKGFGVVGSIIGAESLGLNLNLTNIKQLFMLSRFTAKDWMISLQSSANQILDYLSYVYRTFPNNALEFLFVVLGNLWLSKIDF